MNEMSIWDGLEEEQRKKAVERGWKLVLWARRVAGQIKEPAPSRWEGCRMVSRLEAANKHLLRRLDRAIVRGITELKRDGIEKPLIPLYVGTWEAALHWKNVSEKEDTSLALLMVRIQGTTELVWAMKHQPEDNAVHDELSERGLL